MYTGPSMNGSVPIAGPRPMPRDVGFPHWPTFVHAPPLLQPPPMIGLGCTEGGQCFLAEKQLKKIKRIRTRVDAGEPRNPYSAAAAVTSEGSPSLCLSGASSVQNLQGNYYTVDNPQLSWWNNNHQGQFQPPMSYCANPGVQPFPYFGQNQPFISQNQPNFLASSRQKGAAMLSELFAAHNKSTVDSMGLLDKLTHRQPNIPTSLIHSPEPDNVLLREILQGRKRDILSVEELEAARAIHQNIANNNNNHPLYNKKPTTLIDLKPHENVVSIDEKPKDHNSSHDSVVEDDDIHCDSNEITDVTNETGSPDSSTELSSSDPKKNRLESIVSVIRSSSPSPSITNGINGCKKRKLYMPQQHEITNNVEIPVSSSSPSLSPPLPENKSRKIEADVHEVEDDNANLQIDLSIRSESKLRRTPTPDMPRSSSPKPMDGEFPSNDIPPPNYLFDYAKHLLNARTQNLQHVSHLQEIQNTSNDIISHKLSLLRSLHGGESGQGNQSLAEIESLADLLKTEITSSLTVIIDSIVNKFVQQRKLMCKRNENTAPEISLAHDFNSFKNFKSNISKSGGFNSQSSLSNIRPPISDHNISAINFSAHLRPPLYKSTPNIFGSTLPPVSIGETSPFNTSHEPEQDEALSLVVTPKKKRHKVTDSRLTPKTVGRLLEDLPRYPQITPTSGNTSPRYHSPPTPPMPSHTSAIPSLSHSIHHSLQHPHLHPTRPNPFHQAPPPLLPASLPSSLGMPNPSLHDTTSLLYSGVYSTFNRGPPSPPDNRRDTSPLLPHHLPHHPHHPLLHPAFLAASSPDTFSHFLKANEDRISDCSPGDGNFDQHHLSFYTDRGEYRELSLILQYMFKHF